MFEKYQNPLALAGRILISILFLLSGFGKIMHFEMTAGYMTGHGIPFVQVLLPLTILVEFGGAIMLILGLFTREVALITFLFLIPVTLVFHTSGDQANQIQMLKNISIMGAMLMLVAFGPGSISLDSKRKR